MEHADTELQSQIVLLDGLARLMAGYGAMRQFMTALIASHPDPVRLPQAWESRRTDWVDDEMAQPFFQLPEYQMACTASLGGLTLEVDRAADAV